MHDRRYVLLQQVAHTISIFVGRDREIVLRIRGTVGLVEIHPAIVVIVYVLNQNGSAVGRVSGVFAGQFVWHTVGISVIPGGGVIWERVDEVADLVPVVILVDMVADQVEVDVLGEGDGVKGVLVTFQLVRVTPTVFVAVGIFDYRCEDDEVDCVAEAVLAINRREHVGVLQHEVIVGLGRGTGYHACGVVHRQARGKVRYHAEADNSTSARRDSRLERLHL